VNAKETGRALRDLALIQAALLNWRSASRRPRPTWSGTDQGGRSLSPVGWRSPAWRRSAGDNAKAKTAFETLKKTADAEAGPGSGFAQRAEQMLDRLGN
jgi:hypothetical protein